MGYSLSYNENHEQANWVAYELTAGEVRGSVKRRDAFRSDPMISTGSASYLIIKALVMTVGILLQPQI